MPASGPTACVPKNASGGFAGRTGVCARNVRFGKSDGLVRTGDRTREVYRFMSANRLVSVSPRCPRVRRLPERVLPWRRRPVGSRAGHADLTARVQAIHAGSRRTYGAPRMAELADAGVAVSRTRVARVMRAAGVAGVSRRRAPRTTRRDSQAQPAPDRSSGGSRRRRIACGLPISPTCRRSSATWRARRRRRVVGWARPRTCDGAGHRGAGDGCGATGRLASSITRTEAAVGTSNSRPSQASDISVGQVGAGRCWRTTAGGRASCG